MNFEFIKKCPHCNRFVLLIPDEINCAIYRHGMYKDSLQQIDPHMKKVECDRLVAKGLIYGCGKPFKLKMNMGKLFLEKCGYI